MDFDLQAWMQAFIQVVQEAFAERVRCIGLQGSHARGEAHAESDLDVVVILDSLNAADVARYREAIAPLPHRARMCGFLSGADVLRCWDRADLFQFYHDTEPYFGALASPRCTRCRKTCVLCCRQSILPKQENTCAARLPLWSSSLLLKAHCLFRQKKTHWNPFPALCCSFSEKPSSTIARMAEPAQTKAVKILRLQWSRLMRQSEFYRLCRKNCEEGVFHAISAAHAFPASAD